VRFDRNRTGSSAFVQARTPTYYEELNLRVIPVLKAAIRRAGGLLGHETGISSSVAAVALGACMIERHITADRSMWVPTSRIGG